MLKAEDARLEDPNEQIVAVGFDPIYFPDQPRLTCQHLDQVSSTRPIYLHHASGHLATVNTPSLKVTNITRELRVEGVGRESEVELDGELR